MNTLYNDTTNFSECKRNDFDNELSKMILSASGWRKVFAISGNEEDSTAETGDVNKIIAAIIGDSFAEYIKNKVNGRTPVVLLGIDARPTGTQLADVILRVLITNNIQVQYLDITAAPEIMAYSHKVDGFVYISASHNPVGHNGFKFGLNNGGVIPGSEATILADSFRARCVKSDAISTAIKLATSCDLAKVEAVYKAIDTNKKTAVETYRAFTKEVVSGESDTSKQDKLFSTIKQSAANSKLTIVCDMNGSARTLSIDNTFLPECGLGFYAINNKPREIVHAIIPEPENLVYCAKEIEKLQSQGDKSALLGYMPDCDGDRGNIVYWNEKTQTADVLKAQEVFALSVMSELASLVYSGAINPSLPTGLGAAVSVNDPTSMRIEEITSAFGAKTFRAEVGEANVVNLAREKRAEGYIVRILGEGSNGGNITHPAAVRDPLNTIFALIKLLVIRDTPAECNGSSCKPAKRGLFHLWCDLSGQSDAYCDNFTLNDVIATLPTYTTTGVSEKRAVLKIQTRDHGKLKAAFQKVFLADWESKKSELYTKYGIASWEAICNNGTKETRNVTDFSISGKGGLKILFKDDSNRPIAFIWMRGSGTEPVFRVLCDVKGNKADEEASLLAWETEMLNKADSM